MEDVARKFPQIPLVLRVSTPSKSHATSLNNNNNNNNNDNNGHILDGPVISIQCDHVIEAIRPDIVVEKESNKAIIVDIASPWDHRVYEKEGEKIEKYKHLKREIGRLWGIRHLEVVPVVVGALGVVSNRLDAWLEKLGVTIRTEVLQKTARGGDSNMEQTGMLVANLEFNP